MQTFADGAQSVELQILQKFFCYQFLKAVVVGKIEFFIRPKTCFLFSKGFLVNLIQQKNMLEIPITPFLLVHVKNLFFFYTT